MKRTSSIFITGGTGTVGGDVLRDFLTYTGEEVTVLVHTRGRDEDSIKFLTRLGLNSVMYSSRLRLIRGDITLPKLGLDDTTYNSLSQRTTAILHSAASTRFDLSLEEARRINVNGTENVAQLALAAPRLERFGFVSTAYVSGRRTGTILETELLHNSGFVNSYEQSKYEAENYLTTLSAQLPIAVYRLSTIIGDSRTGHVSHFTAPHQALRIMYLGLASMIPGTTEYSIDLIPSNVASHAIYKLFTEHFTPKKTYHIVAGKKHSYTLKELIDASFAIFAEISPEWATRNYPKPLIVDEVTFDLFLESAEMVDNVIIRNVLGAMKHFAHQLNYPKEFSSEELVKVLPDFEKTLPHIREYYPKVIEYCFATNWGKHVSK